MHTVSSGATVWTQGVYNVQLTILPLYSFPFYNVTICICCPFKNIFNSDQIITTAKEKPSAYHGKSSKYPSDFINGDSCIGITGK